MAYDDDNRVYSWYKYIKSMYAERLTTPSPEIIKAGAEPESLLESVRLKTIKAAYEASDQSPEDKIEAAYATAHLVRQTLRFEPHTALQPKFSPESIATSQRTNCHGYSIVTSECLQEVEIDHRIGYANQHSFILLEDERRVTLIDTPVRQLYTDITPAVIGAPLGAQEDERGAVNMLRGDIILQQSLFTDRERALAERPWLSFTVGRDYRFKGEDEERRAHTLVLRSYQPEQGRRVLEAYAKFTHAIKRRDFLDAHQVFGVLDGVYPDIDKRNQLYGPTRLVRAMARAGDVAAALEDIAIVERSLWPTQDLLMRLWPIDERRRLGVAVGEADLLDTSIEQYEALIDERDAVRASTSAIRGRLARAKRQQKQLSLPS